LCLCSKQTITILNLSNNQIADEGTKHLAKVLPYNTVNINIPSALSLHPHCSIQTITTLDLTNNQIGDSGAESLFEALGGNEVTLTFFSSHVLMFPLFIQTLIVIQLAYNKISDQDNKYLGSTLAKNKVHLSFLTFILNIFVSQKEPQRNRSSQQSDWRHSRPKSSNFLTTQLCKTLSSLPLSSKHLPI
jgi:hypothetical protein